MKGLVLEYPILILIVIVVIIVSIGIIKYFSEQVDLDLNDLPSNSQYLCVQLNNTEIDFENFQDILYLFLKGQCNDFYGKNKQKITIDDIKRYVNAIDSSIQVVQIDECILPKVNTHTVYVNSSEIERGRNIYLKGREIDNSDVLICG